MYEYDRHHLQPVVSMRDDLIHILIRRPDHGTHKLFPQEDRMMWCITLAAKSCRGENCVKWKWGAINLGSPPVNSVKLHPTSSCGMLPMQKRHHTCEGREVKCLCHEVNTELRKSLRTWFGEVCYCPCLSLLPELA